MLFGPADGEASTSASLGGTCRARALAALPGSTRALVLTDNGDVIRVAPRGRSGGDAQQRPPQRQPKRKRTSSAAEADVVASVRCTPSSGPHGAPAEGILACERVTFAPAARCLAAAPCGRVFAAHLGVAISELCAGSRARSQPSLPLDPTGARAPTCMRALCEGSPLREMVQVSFHSGGSGSAEQLLLLVGDEAGDVSAHAADRTHPPAVLAQLEQPVAVLAMVALGSAELDALVVCGAFGRVAVLASTKADADAADGAQGRPAVAEWLLHRRVEAGAVCGANERARLLLLSEGKLLVAPLRASAGGAPALASEVAFAVPRRLDVRPAPQELEHARAVASDANGALLVREDGVLCRVSLEALAAAAPGADENGGRQHEEPRQHAPINALIAEIARLERAAAESDGVHAALNARLAAANAALHAAAALSQRGNSGCGELLPTALSLRLAVRCGTAAPDAVRVRLTNRLGVALGAGCALLIELRQGVHARTECAPLGVEVPPEGTWEHDVALLPPIAGVVQPVRVDASLCVRGGGGDDGEGSALLHVHSGRVDVLDLATAMAAREGRDAHGDVGVAVAKQRPLGLSVSAGAGAGGVAATHCAVVTMANAPTAERLTPLVAAGTWQLDADTKLTLGVERRGGAWAATAASASLPIVAAAHEAITWRLEGFVADGEADELEAPAAAIEAARDAHAHALALVDATDALLAGEGGDEEEVEANAKKKHAGAVRALERLYGTLRSGRGWEA